MAEESSSFSTQARGALLALQALAALLLAAWWLPQHAAWHDGGVLFADYVLLAGWLVLAGGAWARASLRGIGWGTLLLGPLVLICFHLGALASSDLVISFMAIPYFVGACLLWALLVARPQVWESAARPPWANSLWVLASGALVGAVVVGVRAWTQGHYIWPEDKTSLTMLLLPRRDGGASDIFGMPFKQWGAVAPAVAVALATLGLVLWRRALKPGQLLMGLFVLALLGKLAFAGLCTQGYGIVPWKIQSVNNNFYKLSSLVDDQGVYGFLSSFNAKQAGMGFHADTHPPLPILIYWALKHLSFSTPWVVALAVMSLSALALWPLYWMGEALAGAELGVGMAALFATSPMCLILGNSGADSMALTLIAFASWRLVKAAKSGGGQDAVLAGALLAAASMLSFASNASLVFLGTLGLLLVWRRQPAWWPFLAGSIGLWGAFLTGMAAVHGLVWAASGFHFSYQTAIGTARFLHSQANQFRPYELWNWANAVLYAGYAGAGLVGLWAWQQARSLFGVDTRDLSAPVGGAFVLTMVFAAYGRAEVQRQFLFGLVFLLPSAAAALPRHSDGRLQSAPLAWALALNLLTVGLLQAYILDYW